jgi:hypothetical protein
LEINILMELLILFYNSRLWYEFSEKSALRPRFPPGMKKPGITGLFS